jgi:hypothetical protein
VIGLQDAEAQRLREVAAAQARTPPVLERPAPTIDARVASRVDVQVGKLRSAALRARDEHGGTIGEVMAFGAEAAGLNPATVSLVTFGKAAIHLADAATQAEAARAKAEGEKLRQLPEVIRRIQVRKQELDEQVRRGTITDDQRRRSLGTFARSEVQKYGFLTANQDHRLFDNLTSPEARWSIAASLAGVGFSQAAKSSVAKEALGDMWEDAARLLRNSKGGVQATKQLFAHSYAASAELAGEKMVAGAAPSLDLKDMKLTAPEALK